VLVIVVDSTQVQNLFRAKSFKAAVTVLKSDKSGTLLLIAGKKISIQQRLDPSLQYRAVYTSDQLLIERVTDSRQAILDQDSVDMMKELQKGFRDLIEGLQKPPGEIDNFLPPDILYLFCNDYIEKKEGKRSRSGNMLKGEDGWYLFLRVPFYGYDSRISLKVGTNLSVVLAVLVDESAELELDRIEERAASELKAIHPGIIVNIMTGKDEFYKRLSSITGEGGVDYFA
jgi:hypothetical protein